MVRKAAAALMLVLTAAGCASTRAFPDGPILLVCPWAAGGGTDRVARQIAALLEQDLGVPVNVVNVTGGDGVTGPLILIVARQWRLILREHHANSIARHQVAVGEMLDYLNN